MVAISRQYLSRADRAVQIGQVVFVSKGTQPKLRHSKSKIALLTRVSDFFMPINFLFKRSEMFNIALYSGHTQPGEAVLKV